MVVELPWASGIRTLRVNPSAEEPLLHFVKFTGPRVNFLPFKLDIPIRDSQMQ